MDLNSLGYKCSEENLSSVLMFHYQQARNFFDEHGDEELKLKAVITKLFETIPDETMKKQENYAPKEEVLKMVDIAIKDHRANNKKIGTWTRA